MAVRHDRSDRPSPWARLTGWGALIIVVALPLLADHVQFQTWQEVPTDGFAASTTVRLVDSGPVTLTYSLVNYVGHNEGAGNRFQIHESSPLEATRSLTTTAFVPLEETPIISVSLDFAAANGGCCGAPHGVCYDDDTCATAYTAGNGRLHELRGSGDGAVSTPISVNALLSATLEAWAGGLIATAANVAGGAVAIFNRAHDGGGTYLPVTETRCDPPTGNFHWATETNPYDNWLATACRNGAVVNIRQHALPSGTTQWTEQVATLPAPTAFRYAQMEYCGRDTVLPNQTTAQGLAYAVPRNSDIVVGLMAGMGNPSAPQVDVSTTLSGTVDDYYGFTCDGNLVTLLRGDPDGAGLEIVHLDYGNLTGDVNVQITVDDTITPDWINTAPDRSVLVTGSGAEVLDVDRVYLPVVLKTSGPLDGIGQVVHGAIPSMIFFDGFESGGTDFWSATVGASADPSAEGPVDGR